MDPIPVPAPPRSAYNPNRRVSDLLLNQLKHFQHVELKRGDLGIDPALARNIHTEAGAAQYIAAITRALCSKASAAASETTPAAPKNPPTQNAAKKSSAKSTAKPGARNNKGKR